MACPSLDSLPDYIVSNACWVANAGTNALVQSALQTCCGRSNVFTINSGCYTYCNITTSSDDIAFWTLCLADNLDPQTFAALDELCESSFGFDNSSSSDATSTTAARIATTWTAPDETLTVTASLSGAAISTLVLSQPDFAELTANGSSTIDSGASTTSIITPVTANASSTTAIGNSITANSSLTTGPPRSGVSTFEATLTPAPKSTTASSSPSPTKSSKAAVRISIPNLGLAALFGLVFFQVLV
jgi:hypothetical protein